MAFQLIVLITIILVIAFVIPLVISFIFIAISIIFMPILLRVSKNTNKKKKYNKTTKFVGIIIGKRKISGMRSSLENIHIYSNSIFLLLYRLKHLKLNYKIIFVEKGRDFERAIINKNMESVFIFSHGCEYGIALSDGLYRYKNLRGKIKKKIFIAQLHCNKKETKTYPRMKIDTSLQPFCITSYIKDDYRNSISNTFYLLLHFPKHVLLYK